MKNERMTVSSLVVFTLLFVLLSSGCGTSPNANTDQSKDLNKDTKPTPVVTATPSVNACVGTTLQEKAESFNKYLEGEIVNAPGSNPFRESLKTQYQKGLFRFKAVVTAPPSSPPGTPSSSPTPTPMTMDSIYLYVGGSMGDIRGAKGRNVFQPFLDLLKPYHIGTCVNRIVFVRLSEVPQTVSAVSEQRIDGFDWFGCDDPNVPCPGGICAPSCL